VDARNEQSQGKGQEPLSEKKRIWGDVGKEVVKTKKRQTNKRKISKGLP